MNYFDESIYERLQLNANAFKDSGGMEFVDPKKGDSAKKFKALVKSRAPYYLVMAFYTWVVVYGVVNCFNMAKALYSLSIGYLNYNVFVMVMVGVVPALVWIGATAISRFAHYRNVKILTAGISVFSFLFVVMEILYAITYYLFLPWIFKMPINEYVTVGMIVGLARGVICFMTLVPGFCLAVTIFRQLFSKKTSAILTEFCITKNWDLRKNRDFSYDASFVRKIDDGRYFSITESDRTLHMLIDGQSGTAKTSSILNVQILNDLMQRACNEDFLKKNFAELVRSGDFVITKEFHDDDFSVKNFVPRTEKGKKKYDKLCKMAPIAGITVIAPNSELCDSVCEYASMRHIRVNRIDPELLDNGMHKPGFVGFNPLYVSPKKKGIERQLDISIKACALADTLQAIFDEGGGTDLRFAGVNANVTTSVAMLLMLTYEGLKGRQPTVSDVQYIINDFSRAKDFVDALEHFPGHEDFQFLIDFVRNQMLGFGREKLERDSFGLKNMFNRILANPMIKDALCRPDSVDLDSMLENGEVTVFNFATCFGAECSRAFGLLFMLSYGNAVMKRPRGFRTPNFCYIDEFPMVLHAKLEIFFSYFRQYKSCLCVAIQTLDQLDKTSMTRHFKSILSGLGTLVFFGRISPSEMELIERLGGTVEEIEYQESISQNSITEDDPNKSWSVRGVTKEKNRLNGGDVRYMRFQHVIMCTVSNNTPIRPFEGKVDFVGEHEKFAQKRVRKNWAKMYAAQPEEWFLEVQDLIDEEKVEPVMVLEETADAEDRGGSDSSEKEVSRVNLFDVVGNSPLNSAKSTKKEGSEPLDVSNKGAVSDEEGEETGDGGADSVPEPCEDEKADVSDEGVAENDDWFW